MRKKLWIFSTGLFFCTTLFAQDTLIATTTATTTAVDTVYNSTQLYKATKSEQVYKLKPAVDIPVTAIGAGWSAFAFGKIYSKDPSTTAKILSLKVSDLNGFDRWAADEFSESAAKTSDLFFYGSMPMPILLLLDKHIRRDAPKIAFLYLQAMSVTGLLYTGSTFLVDRYRPLAYNPEATMEERTGGGAKNSFFAGHVALVGTATFFTAKILSDYHPDSKWRPVFFGAAALATGATGYLRHRGGKHFPSDILIGTTVGTLSGILVPHFHKNKVFKNTGLTVLPFTGKS
ncbi:MAG TPA: phosphatase PAP2 family protein, partial [Chitinophagaceae bacterium]|nr:phosphatase PAP2 family protein [Chitinophagaceae bacterium]